jgi:hypothetical protein
MRAPLHLSDPVLSRSSPPPIQLLPWLSSQQDDLPPISSEGAHQRLFVNVTANLASCANARERVQNRITPWASDK